MARSFFFHPRNAVWVFFLLYYQLFLKRLKNLFLCVFSDDFSLSIASRFIRPKTCCTRIPSLRTIFWRTHFSASTKVVHDMPVISPFSATHSLYYSYIFLFPSSSIQSNTSFIFLVLVFLFRQM